MVSCSARVFNNSTAMPQRPGCCNCKVPLAPLLVVTTAAQLLWTVCKLVHKLRICSIELSFFFTRSGVILTYSEFESDKSELSVNYSIDSVPSVRS